MYNSLKNIDQELLGLHHPDFAKKDLHYREVQQLVNSELAELGGIKLGKSDDPDDTWLRYFHQNAPFNYILKGYWD